MKIVIITSDEPFYLPLTFHKLLESSASNSIKRIILLPPTAKKRTWKTIIEEQMGFGLLYFIYRTVQYMVFKVLSRINLKIKGRYYSIEAVAKAYKVGLSKVRNINSDQALDIIRQEKPDLMISLSASQVFSEKVINLPKWATLNVHNAPLPKYQGLMPSFWVLYHGEKETATTVHLMDKKIDTGDIVVQKKVPISVDETIDSLIKKTKLLTVDALLETFAIFQEYDGKPPVMANRPEEATYFGFPSKNDIKEFRRRGKRFLCRHI